MTKHRNDNRIQIYAPIELKKQLARKAKKLGMSVSRLLVTSALDFKPCHEENDSLRTASIKDHGDVQ